MANSVKASENSGFIAVSFRFFGYGAFCTDYVFVSGSEFVTGTGFGIGYEYRCNDFFFLRAAAVSE